MKYKRLLVVLPFIVVFLILSITVEMNVIATYSVVTLVNRVLVQVIGLLCLAILIPKINWKWLILMTLNALSIVSVALYEEDIARNCFRKNEVFHGVYFGLLEGTIAFVVIVCVVYQLYCLAKQDDKAKSYSNC